MTLFEKTPLLRFLLPLIAGTALGRFSHISATVLLLILSILIIVLFLIAILSGRQDEKMLYRYQWIEGFLISCSIMATGIFLSINYQSYNNTNHFSRFVHNEENAILQVSEPPSIRKNAVKAVLEVIAVYTDNGWVKTSGKVIQYFEKDTLSSCLKYGDRIVQKAHFTQVPPPLNPHEFNYQKYLADDNIYHQSYIRKGSWKIIGRGYGNLFLRAGYQARYYIQDKLEASGLKGDEYAVVTALILGVRDKLDADLLKSYSSTGTVHILSVSGMHVGLIFILLGLMLSFLDKKAYGRIVSSVLIIFLIWFYAVITGLAPSVQRAATMFTVIILAKLLRKQANIYNTLAFSASLLIIITPAIIAKPGFWLSYLAVLGIVYLYPRFYGLFSVKNKFLEKLWALLCVSLAAQIATSPLSIYYFNQFPNYFLISNIIVVPLATIIVYGGIALFAFSFVPVLSHIIAFALTYLLKGLNFTVHIIENLPYSTSVVVIDYAQMILLYLFLGFIIYYFESRKTVVLKVSLIVFLTLVITGSFKAISNQHEKKITFYAQDKGMAIDIKSGTNVVFIADSVILRNPALIDFHLKSNRLKHGARNITTVPLSALYRTDSVFNENTYIYHHFISFMGCRFMLINTPVESPSSIIPGCDYIYFTGEGTIKSTDKACLLKTKKIILGAGIPFYKRTALHNDFKNTDGFIVFDSKKRGAFTINAAQ